MANKKIDILTFFGLAFAEAYWSYHEETRFAIGSVCVYAVLIFKHWAKDDD